MSLFGWISIDSVEKPELLYLWNNSGTDYVARYSTNTSYYYSYGNILKKDNGVLSGICSFNDVNRNAPRWYSTSYSSYASGSANIVKNNPYCLKESETVWGDSKAYDIKDGISGLFDGVTEVNYLIYLFRDNTGITELPDLSNITSVGNYGLQSTFYGCDGLTGTPDLSNLTTVGNYGLYRTFWGCTGLTGTPDFSNLTSVGQYGLERTFYGCTGLTGTPDFSNLTSVGKWGLVDSFDRCTGLTGTPDLSNITSVGESGLSGTFSGCTGLTGKIPDLAQILVDNGCTTFNSSGIHGTFSGCTGLTGNVSDYRVSKVTEARDYEFTGQFSGCTGLTGNVSDLSNITSVGKWGLQCAFERCTGLTGTPDLSNITSVGTTGLDRTFPGCTGLTGTPKLPNITSIPSLGLRETFSGCTGLTGTPDLSNITSVGSYGLNETFRGCTGLTGDVYFSSLDPTKVTITDTSESNNPFYECFYGCTGINGVHFPYNLTPTQKQYLTDSVIFGIYDGTKVCFDINAPLTISGVTDTLTVHRFDGGTDAYNLSDTEPTTITVSPRDRLVFASSKPSYFEWTNIVFSNDGTIQKITGTGEGFMVYVYEPFDYGKVAFVFQAGHPYSSASTNKLNIIDVYQDGSMVNIGASTELIAYLNITTNVSGAKVYYGKNEITSYPYTVQYYTPYTFTVLKDGYNPYTLDFTATGFNETYNQNVTLSTASQNKTVNVSGYSSSEPLTIDFNYSGLNIKTVTGTTGSVTFDGDVEYVVKCKGYKTVKGTLSGSDTVTVTLEESTATIIELRYPFTENAQYLEHLVDNSNFYIRDASTAPASCIASGSKSYNIDNSNSYGYIEFTTPDTTDTEFLTLSVSCACSSEQNYDIGMVWVNKTQQSMPSSYSSFRISASSVTSNSTYGTILYNSYSTQTTSFVTRTTVLEPNTKYYLQFGYIKDSSSYSGWDRLAISNIKLPVAG